MTSGEPITLAHSRSYTSTPGLPRLIVWSVFFVTILPMILNVFGIGFGIEQLRTPALLSDTTEPSNLVQSIRHGLTGSFIHTLLEWSAFVTAIFVVIFAFIHYQITGNAVAAIIGMAFLFAGLMDAFSAIAVNALIDSVEKQTILLPFIWAVCRLFNILILIIGVTLLLILPHMRMRSGLIFTFLLFGAFTLTTYMIYWYSNHSYHLPATIYPYSFIKRPFDALPLLLFPVALYVFRKLYTREPGLFSHSLVVSLFPLMVMQFHMVVGSSQLYDNHFTIAYFLKIIAYLVPFIGLGMDYIRTYRNKEYAISTLEATHSDLKQRSKELEQVNQDLERKIEERERFEEALLELEFKYARVVEYAADGVIIIQGDKIQFTNKAMADILGYREEELLNKGYFSIISEDHIDIERSRHEELIKNKMAPIVYEGRFMCKDSTTVRELEVNAAAIPHEGLSAIVAVFRDITQRKQIEEQLARAKEAAEEANQAKSEFLALMSHEIRTPITAVVGYSELLNRPNVSRKEYKQWVHKLQYNAQHLLALVNDILDLSKIEAGELSLTMEPVDLLVLSKRLSALMQPLAAEKLLDFNVRFEGPVPRQLYTDPIRLNQILINLNNNAIKFTESGSVTLTINITENKEEDTLYLNFEVQDTGIGIPEDKLKTIFDPFTQVQDIRKARSGTGLGLSISTRLAQMLGGRMTVESKVGTGSKFTFHLRTDPKIELVDLGDKYLQELDSLEEEESGYIDLENKSILLVDDSPDNRRIIRYLLEEVNAEVSEAENGQEAISLVLFRMKTSDPFDLVLMDMRMPVMDGYTATAKLRELGIDLPIVALTAHTMAEDKNKCLEVGCNDYISKPMLPNTFFRVVGKLLNIEQSMTPQTDSLRQMNVRMTNEVKSPAMSSPADDTDGTNAKRVPEVLESEFSSVQSMAPLLQKYKELMNDVIEQLKEARAKEDVEQLSLLAHRLKGSGASYGFPDISTVAGKYERAIEDGAEVPSVDNDLEKLIALLSAATKNDTV